MAVVDDDRLGTLATGSARIKPWLRKPSRAPPRRGSDVKIWCMGSFPDTSRGPGEFTPIHECAVATRGERPSCPFATETLLEYPIDLPMVLQHRELAACCDVVVR